MSSNLKTSDPNIASRTSIDVLEVMELIPHRPPFLMIDRVEDIVQGESAVGVKNVTIDEPFFAGHFPKRPVFPGVLIIEAMAQTAAVLVVETLGDDAPRFDRQLIVLPDGTITLPLLMFLLIMASMSRLLKASTRAREVMDCIHRRRIGFFTPETSTM